MFNVDLKQMRIIMREAMKDELSDLIMNTIKDEFSIPQKLDIKKSEAMELKSRKF